eukprot:CAMPEP_0175080742 /NCGR_PEP_ID=MMETSP0052_2-20121109/25711_1 /TAXON_ID=51329 ORGANISM="Polytomella parva, Strain SAG 63-3" /NCGR_SAMPLE_ID=MMETSP0052_2 /ASSEMBLY_ACC=CAM_ASM_000194 /LENGTH=354 /DNA_ID=CAMNT_0016351545 /DNA_START=170 /DNA_END=1234 /DNA_ORIENTATION=-
MALKSYYQLAKQYHPDANKGDAAAAQKFQEVQKAYEALRDPQKRQLYDQMGPDGYENMQTNGGGASGAGAGFPGNMGGGFPGFHSGMSADIFSSFFGSNILFQQVTVPPICLSFLESLRSVRRKISFQTMHGRELETTIEIPANSDDGDILHAQINDPSNPHMPITLVIPIQIIPHRSFRREGLNIVSSLKMPLVKALLGDVVQVETVDGFVDLIVPPCSRHGDELRIHARGITEPTRNGGLRRGDHVVNLNIVVPSVLNSKQRKLLMEIQEEEERKFMGAEHIFKAKAAVDRERERDAASAQEQVKKEAKKVEEMKKEEGEKKEEAKKEEVRSEEAEKEEGKGARKEDGEAKH